MGIGDWLKCPFAGDKTGALPAGHPQVEKAAVVEEKKTPSCKICCACPSTRSARDECIIRNGEENCKSQIEAHYQCLLTEGFTEEQVNKLRAASQR
ncbi:Cytochrome c oxidase copper chaperone 1 [Diplonema papillatum]|nr:Cytochrome c oxidase copper chaperone 1 [Diplonema papillatum]